MYENACMICMASNEIEIELQTLSYYYKTSERFF